MNAWSSASGGFILPALRRALLVAAGDPLPDNVIGMTRSRRAWTGVEFEVTGYQCEGEGIHLLPHRDRARLTVVLDESDGICEPLFRPNAPCPADHIPRHIHFAPAGLEMWGYSSSWRSGSTPTRSTRRNRVFRTTAYGT